ncbi:MAG: hypothetical protein RIB43_08595 [Rhodospirillaceae bacterium]
MRHLIKTAYRIALMAPLLLWSAFAAAQTGDSEGPNTNILRWASGTYAYTTLTEPRDRGWERFHMNVYTDGSRAMNMWHDLSARDAQFTVILRVNDAFRPQEAFLSYWVANGFKGSTLIRVEDATLSASANGPAGLHNQTLTVPATFSIGTHPVSADGWHLASDSGENGAEQTSKIYSLEASADLTKPPLGTLRDLTFKRIGEETLTVPAGTFETIHYDLSGSQVWVTKQDRLMVRMINERFDRDYVLTEFASGSNGEKIE